MFDNDAIRFPEFTNHLFEALLQPPSSLPVRISQEGSGTLPSFPAFDPDDDVVSITLTLPQQTFFIPHPQHPAAYPFRFRINQRLDVTFYPWAETDDPMFLEGNAALIKVYVDVVLEKDIVCLGSDMSRILDAYMVKAEQYFEPFRDLEDHHIRVPAQVCASMFSGYLDVEKLSMVIPCCLPASMMADPTFPGLMAAIDPWVDSFYRGEAKLFEFITLTLWIEQMTLPGSSHTRPMRRMILLENGQ